MPSAGEKFRALLATGRVANIPTVCSNVLAGFWLAGLLAPAHSSTPLGEDPGIATLLSLMLVCSAIYVAGCMLGDAVDVNFDRRHRPGRPIPSGILSAGTVKSAALFLFLLAITGLVFSHYRWAGGIQLHVVTLAALLILLVMSYAFFHKKNKAAALLMMASCRFLLVMLAIAAAHTYLPNSTDWLRSWILILPLSVAAYTLLLSWVASTESKPGAFKSRNILAWLLLALPASTIALHQLAFPSKPIAYLPAFIALVILYLWLAYTLSALRTSKPAFVSRALAGFCLLDACFLAPVAPGLAAICLLLFALALILQRIAPAT
jgi:4-hydroxybenzoate polyprenyltransferase